MKAKFVNENIHDLFKPKTPKEIRKGLPKLFPIECIEDATRVLRAGIIRENLEIVKYAIENGAEIIYSDGSGNLWVALNSGDNEILQEIIIFMLKNKKVKERFNNNFSFRQALFSKILFMGMINVAEWILENYEIKASELKITLNSENNALFKWPGTGMVSKIFLNFINSKINENINQIFKPKNKDQIDDEISKLEPNKQLLIGFKIAYLNVIFNALENGANKFTGELYSYDRSDQKYKSLLLYLVRNKYQLDNQVVLNNILKRSCKIDFYPLVKWTLEEGADPNFKDNILNTPIYYAAKAQSLKIVKLLLKNSADINVQNRDGITALMASLTPITLPGYNAPISFNSDVFWYIFNNVNVDLSLKNNDGQDILKFALEKRRNKIAEKLMSTIKIKYDKMDLYNVATNGTLKNLKKILDSGINPNQIVKVKYGNSIVKTTPIRRSII